VEFIREIGECQSFCQQGRPACIRSAVELVASRVGGTAERRAHMSELVLQRPTRQELLRGHFTVMGRTVRRDGSSECSEDW